MVPDDVPSNWRVLGAEGAYDGYARQFAANLVAAGMGNAVIRLGHEMNGNWYHDSLGNDPAQYGTGPSTGPGSCGRCVRSRRPLPVRLERQCRVPGHSRSHASIQATTSWM